MINLTERVPHPGSVSLEEIGRWALEVAGSPRSRPFDDHLIEFGQTLSRLILEDGSAQKHAELVALGFWLRRASLTQLKNDFAQLSQDQILVPRGLVFHVPPSNVDTMFVYSWFLSLLTGNANLVRLPTRGSHEQAEILLSLVSQAFARHPDIASRTRMLEYGHEETINQTFSELADVRVIWGGDSTVGVFKKFPTKPRGKDLVFPDRFSGCLISSAGYLQSSDESKISLAKQFFNDAYLFDQKACSSPRLVVWVGEKNGKASQEFWTRLQNEISRREYRVATATALEKMSFSFNAALISSGDHVLRLSNECTVLTLGTLKDWDRSQHCGGGMFFETWVKELGEFTGFLADRDQTYTHFGFEPSQLRDWIIDVGGRGGDRFVPVGQALSFQRYWDGYDLLQEFCRYVSLEQT